MRVSSRTKHDFFGGGGGYRDLNCTDRIFFQFLRNVCLMQPIEVQIIPNFRNWIFTSCRCSMLRWIYLRQLAAGKSAPGSNMEPHKYVHGIFAVAG